MYHTYKTTRERERERERENLKNRKIKPNYICRYIDCIAGLKRRLTPGEFPIHPPEEGKEGILQKKKKMKFVMPA